MMDKIQFQTNVPVEVALKYPAGKECPSQFGEPQVMYTTVDGRVFFVHEKVAQKIHGLRLQPGERIDVCKAEVAGSNGRKFIEWQISRVDPPAGEQSNGTFRVPAAGGVAAPPTPAAAASIPPMTNHANGSTRNGNGHAPAIPLKMPLDMAVVDAVRMVQAAMKETGEQWSDQSRQDLVSTILITAQREGWLAGWRSQEASHA